MDRDGTGGSADFAGARKRLPGLDLYRAAAAVMVAAAHFSGGFSRVSGAQAPYSLGLGGFFGVELFFVLSGFLIGGLLLDIVAREPDGRSWRTFMIRRWMRTVPLYVFWVLVLLVVVPPARDVLWHAVKYLTFTQNLAWPMPKGNWFGVSWTLAVEEWFYLLFSALLVGLAIRWPRRAYLVTCLIFIVVPAVVRFSLADESGNWDTMVRKIVVFRLDAIAYGALLAWAWRQRPQLLITWRWPLFATGALLLAFVIVMDLHPTLFGQVTRSVMITAGLCGFVLAFPAALAVRRLPLYGLVHWVSERSYAIYIVHLDIARLFIYQVHGLPPMLYLPTVIVATLLVADLCHRFVEQPVMRRRPPQFAPRTRSESRTYDVAGLPPIMTRPS